MGTFPPALGKRVPIIRLDVRLAQDAAQRSHRNFLFTRNDGYIGRVLAPADKLDVAAFLRSFDEADCLQAPFHLVEWKRLKPPQPLPR